MTLVDDKLLFIHGSVSHASICPRLTLADNPIMNFYGFVFQADSALSSYLRSPHPLSRIGMAFVILSARPL